MTKRTIGWIFDALPPSGARRGGDPSKHAFRHDLGTFVREVVQNANDQAISWPTVRFRLTELCGDELEGFLQALSWNTLRPHLFGAAQTKGGSGIKPFLQKIEKERRLLLLHVEDRNTIGLTGDESEGESHFRALCKDTLYSHKTSTSAGGSYGLGKSVLWTFSGLSTVVFCSSLLEEPKGCHSPRLIGRAELPSHPVDKGKLTKWFSGSGWYGTFRRLDNGSLRAESVWGTASQKRAAQLDLSRSDGYGTSVLIVGFRDPTSETDDRIETLVQRIEEAAVRSFWPAMVMETRRLKLAIESEKQQRWVNLDDHLLTRPFVDCYRRRFEKAVGFEKPGDIAVCHIPFDLPPLIGSSKTVSGQLDLIVRLAPEGTRHPLLGHIALFRGPGMVVKYWDRSNVSIGIRAFHAVLVCGEARNPIDVSDADRAVEQFLRASEPPGHDDWHSTSLLKEKYKRGYAKTLQRLKDRVTETLRKLLVVQPLQGTEGPQHLQKKFPIGGRGGRGSEPSLFHFSSVAAHFDGWQWRFRGVIQSERRSMKWQVILSLTELGEDGQPVESVPIGKLEIETKGVSFNIKDGQALIDTDGEVDEVCFRGNSRPVCHSGYFPAELCLEITGRLSTEMSR